MSGKDRCEFTSGSSRARWYADHRCCYYSVRIRGVRHTRTMHAINFDAMVVQLLESKAARMVSPRGVGIYDHAS